MPAMPLSKWCQLMLDANVGRNAEKQHPTFITVRGGGGPESCLLSVGGELSREERGGGEQCWPGPPCC